MQRRRHDRYRLWFPVRVRASALDGAATSQDIGAGGMLVAVTAKIEPGSLVTVRFRVPPEAAEERVVQGRVVRLEHNADDPEGWPYRVAIAFEDIELDLIPVLEAAANELAAMS